MTSPNSWHQALLACACVCLSLAGPAQAAEQAERAIAAVKQLVSSGEIQPSTLLKLRVKQGNMVSFLGRDYELQKEWEAQTGVMLDATVMPQLDSLAFIRDTKDIDLTIARNHEYPDLFAQGLIEDLTPLLKRFGFTLAQDTGSGYMLLKQQAYLGGRVLAIPADLDAVLLFVRKDLLEDPAQRARFAQRYGHALNAPRTWQDYDEQVAFFNRPQDGFYGAAEPREPHTGWMYWMPRYLSAAAPNQYLFDDQMHPMINSPAGVAATQSYVATVASSPPQVLEDGKDYSYTLPFFIRGNAYATLLTVATAKLANREGSEIKGKFMAVPMPGHLVKGQLLRRTHFMYGNNLVVPARAPHKALALLFAMWLTDPDNAARSVAANGIADPYRYSSLRDERVRAMYTPQALAMLEAELPTIAPSGTGLPGNSEYLAALNAQLWLAASGKLLPKEAMARTAREWEAITERRGRSSQIAHWLAFKRLYPGAAEPVR